MRANLFAKAFSFFRLANAPSMSKIICETGGFHEVK